MTKRDIATEIYYRSKANNPIDVAVAEAAINAFVEIVKEAVASGQSVTIRGFGSFSPIQRAPKVARNIRKNQKLIIPAHLAPRFDPSDTFLSQVKLNAAANSTDI